MPWTRLLTECERLPAAPLEDWYAAVQARSAGASPFEQALLGGAWAATPGLAFLAGYQAALRVLWPAAPQGLGALCVTENRSTRPADMTTRLEGLQLTGRKDFVTAAEAAEWLLVAAREESDGEAPRIALMVVRNGDPGVKVEPLPALPLMPDVGHARLELRAAPSERLAGDGWADYVKPFRTLEDVHVLTALAAWLYGVGRECGWPPALQMKLLAILAGASETARQPATSAAGHVLLAALFDQLEGLAGELEAALAAGPQHWQTLWLRDRGLLRVASAARAKRLTNARAALGLDAGQ